MVVDGYYNMKAGIGRMMNGFAGEEKYDTRDGMEELFAAVGGLAGNEQYGRNAYLAASFVNPAGAGKINAGIEIVETAAKVSGKADVVVEVAKGTGKSLLPGEGNVGTYEELIDAGSRGDNITPHHMPSQKYMETNAGVHKNDGVSMNMEQPYPGKGGRHRQTETYGMNGQKLNDYLKLSPRDALARDIWDARKIYQKDGLYTPEIRQGLQEVIDLNKDMYPNLSKNK